jgi:hypothetical protein
MFADEREKKLYVKRAGPYLLGPTLEKSPVKSITHYLAREDGTDKFVSVKVIKYYMTKFIKFGSYYIFLHSLICFVDPVGEVQR